jgi:hypothetical protein
MFGRLFSNKTISSRLIACLFFIGLIGSARCSGDTPDRPVTEFYNLYLKLKPIGLPTREQEQAMAPYLSERLRRLLGQAHSYKEAFMRKNPEDKPPWADGCLFASLFEGPKRFKISKVIANSDGTSMVTVHFWYDSQVANWEDKVIVRREGGRFVIDDFVLSGVGPFNPPGRLSEMLKDTGEY